MIRMATLEQALALITEHGRAAATGVETLPLASAEGWRLAEPVIAQVSQPPADVSAMDGYAIDASDAKVGASLKLIGESRAGKPFTGAVRPGEAVRVFTGAYIPRGANHVVIQEDTRSEGAAISITAPQSDGHSIRRQGLDFVKGAVLVPAGTILNEGALSLAAAGNAAKVVLRQSPFIGVLANGDELVPPGSPLQPGQIVNSVQPALMALIRRWGASAIDLGVASDTIEDVRRRIAQPCDVIVSIGGASVGDYDVARPAFAAEGFEPVFEKVAIKPGKPTWFSRSPHRLVLGLPGNPAAAMVTAQLFLRPLIDAMMQVPQAPTSPQRAHTRQALPKTGNRTEFLRAILAIGEDGRANVTAAENQDSSLLSPFLTANALIRRPANSAPAAAGDLVDIVRLV